jgi:hypothetical protein
MTVTLPYDPEWKALAWAKDHCPSYITNEVRNNTRLKKVPGGWVPNHRIVYHFSDERDATFFALRWS